MVDQDGKQRAWSKVNRRDLVINKTGLKGVHCKGIHIKKEGPTRQSYGESSCTFSGKPAHGGPSLKRLYTNAHHTGSVPLQSYDVIGTMERWWDSSHDWHAALSGYGLFRKDSLGRQGGGDVRAAGLCLEMGDEASGKARARYTYPR